MRVCDGDTIIVAREGQDGAPEQVRVRLYGIDAPETSGRGRETQPFGKASRRFLSDLLASGRVAVIDLGTDKYARIIGGVVSLPEGAVVQEELLKAGLAWVYPRYCRDCRRWRLLEEEARAARVGVWEDADPVPPWEWRKRGREK